MPGFPDGDTRIHLILGDPVAQTRSPAGLTAEFRRRGVNAICIPLQVAPADFGGVMTAVQRVKNLDGIVVTLPHKFAALQHCSAASQRARFLSAANVLRRTAAGSWQGDMTDGAATVAALERAGCRPRGRRALVVGAGGAGSAAALALLEAGVAALAVADVDPARRAGLVARLAARTSAAVTAGACDPRGCDVVIHATPAGMGDGDPLPLDPAGFEAAAVVVDLVTRPAVTRLASAARERGCTVVTGADMFAQGVGMMADFLLAARPAGASPQVADPGKSR